MDNCFEIIRQSLELSSTVGEGLQHLRISFEKGCCEDTLTLFQDVIHAFISIQQAVEPFATKLPPNQLTLLTDEINNALEYIVSAYEKSSWIILTEILENKLIPAHCRWERELEHCFGSYIAC